MDPKKIAKEGIKYFTDEVENCFNGITKPVENKVSDAVNVIVSINKLELPVRSQNQLKYILFGKLCELHEKEIVFDLVLESVGTSREETQKVLEEEIKNIFTRT